MNLTDHMYTVVPGKPCAGMIVHAHLQAPAILLLYVHLYCSEGCIWAPTMCQTMRTISGWSQHTIAITIVTRYQLSLASAF
jgi:hypothetical protein